MKVLALVCLLATVGYVAAYQSCPTTSLQPDLVLVVEDSNKIPAGDGEQKLRSFLAEIANNFHLELDTSRVAYARYNAARTTMFNLNKYDQTNDAKSAILTAAFARPDVTPAPVIADALTYTWTDLLTVTNGERSCHPTVIVLVSFSSYLDPNSGVGAVDPLLIANDLSAVRRLKNSGALVITVGVGPDRSPKHLLELASGQEYYHDYPSFDDLNDAAADAIAAQACGYAPDGRFFPCEMKAVQADIVFVVDVGHAYGANAAFRTAVVDFMNNTLYMYDYNHVTGVQAALVTYQKDADVAINFNDHDTLDSFLSAADTTLQITCPDYPQRCVNEALDKITRSVLNPNASPSSGYRQTCTIHQIYIFTSDCFDCDDPVPFANALRTGPTTPNTEIFVIPLIYGEPPNYGFWKEYLEIADDASHLWEAQPDPVPIVTEYLHKQAWRAVCRSFGPVRCPPTASTTTSGTTTTTVATTTTIQG